MSSTLSAPNPCIFCSSEWTNHNFFVVDVTSDLHSYSDRGAFCRTCSRTMYYCRLCHNSYGQQSINRYTVKSFIRHFKADHSSVVLPSVPFTYESENTIPTSVEQQINHLLSSQAFMDHSERSLNSVNNNFDENDDIAVDHAGSCFPCTDNLTMDMTPDLSNEINLGLQNLLDSFLQQLSFHLTISQIEILCDLLKIIKYSYKMNLHLDFPTEYKDIRRLFIDGKNSLPQQVTKELNIYKDTDDNVLDEKPSTYYVSLRSIIKFHLKFRNILSMDNHITAVDSPVSTDHQTIFESKKISEETQRIQTIHELQTFRDQPFIHLFASIWSDGFEKNTCKKSRGSSWVQTISFFSKDNPMYKKDYGTYTLAIGPDDAKRIHSQRSLINEINDLSYLPRDNLFYVQGKNIYVYVSIVCWLGDQPERRSYCGLLAGNSIVHTRWGLKYNHKLNFEQLKPCSRCRHHLFNNLKKYFKRREKVKFKTKPCCLVWDGFASKDGQKITFKKLIKWSRQGMVLKDEPGDTQKTFFQMNGIRDDVRLAINGSKPNDTILDILPPSWSSPWNNVSLSLVYVDVPMHLLFLGITKSLFYLIRDYIKNIESFEIKSMIHNSLQLTFKTLHQLKNPNHPLLPYDKEKGLVSENFVAVARLFNWIASVIWMIDDSYYEHIKKKYDITNIKTWTAKMIKDFLSSLGKNCSGRKGELLQRALKAAEDLQRGLICESSSRFAELLSLFYKIVSHVMQNKYSSDHIHTTEIHILRFMTCMAEYSPKTVQNKYNYLSLMNFPKLMKHFGPVRNIWEGGYRGEKFLSVLKPLIHRNSSSWEYNLLRNCFTSQEIDYRSNILYNTISNHHTTVQLLSHRIPLIAGKRRCFKVYNSREEVQTYLDTSQPLSAALVHNDIYVCVKDADSHCFYQLLPMSSTMRRCPNINVEYFVFTISLDGLRNINIPEESYSILLPQKSYNNVGNQCSYHVINSEWESYQLSNETSIIKFSC